MESNRRRKIADQAPGAVIPRGFFVRPWREWRGPPSVPWEGRARAGAGNLSRVHLKMG
jgi:hypothetical protein